MNTLKNIIKNEILQTVVIGIGTILLLLSIGGLLIYGYDRATYDSEEEKIAKENRERAKIRVESFKKDGLIE